jgi:hypothetical protein
MSIPRCWPAAYGSSPRTNFWSTGPLTGQVQAPAVGTITSAAASTTIRARRICFLLVVLIANSAPRYMGHLVVVNMDYRELS